MHLEVDLRLGVGQMGRMRFGRQGRVALQVVDELGFISQVPAAVVHLGARGLRGSRRNLLLVARVLILVTLVEISQFFVAWLLPCFARALLLHQPRDAPFPLS